MGNYASCHFNSQTLSAQLIDSLGGVRRLEIPVKVAELMIESPGHMISRPEEVRRTRRVVAMRADEVLAGGKIYLLLPVGRANCKASDEEMAWIDATCRRWRRRKSGGGKKVFPDAPVKRHVACDDGESGIGCPRQRLGNHRLWTPALETIDEGI